jgi:hypothetical protein
VVGNLGMRRRSLLCKLLDQHSGLRDGIGWDRITVAEDSYQRLRTTLRRTKR